MEFKILKVLANVLIIVKIVTSSFVIENTNGRPAFDESVYNDALDPDLCRRQLEVTRNNVLLWLRFVESGIRIPRGTTIGNFNDLGNYPECIGINEEIDSTVVEGKYCTLTIPANQNINIDFESLFPDLSGINLPDWISIPDWINIPDWIDIPDWINLPDWITRPDKLQFKVREDTLKRLKDLKNKSYIAVAPTAIARTGNLEGLSSVSFSVATCIPKACTVDEGISGLFFNVTALGFHYEVKSCRFRNDKPWVPADYVTITVFSLLGLLTVLSTSYDIYHTIICKSDPKTLNPWCRSFSVYTNGRRLTTFSKSAGTIDCLDGIRTLSMIWVILGHTFITLPPIMNGFDIINWLYSSKSFWISTAPISVDTFFMLSGLLLVYSTAKKMSGMSLLKNLHLFYLNRLLRMFPLLATCVLLDAAFYHRVFDGPFWDNVYLYTSSCRKNWWLTLLYVQNIFNYEEMCVPHSWYLAIDMHLHILSPIVLFFVLGRRRKTAWSTLITSVLVVIASTAVYSFLMDLDAHTIVANTTTEKAMRYYKYYYIQTLSRAPSFLIGMVVGYILHVYRENKFIVSKTTASLLWIVALALIGLSIYITDPLKDPEWDNSTLNGLINTFHRPIWTIGLGWVIVACVHGYGGPINWFLSLEMWKLPSRISYAMYLFHYQMMFAIAGTSITTYYFTVSSALYEFYARLLLTFIVSFFLTLLIDSPFSTVFKLLLEGGPKQPRQKKENGN